jgi:hypothetical protein
VRRRARFLRKARELAYRDLGGLVFNLHRFGQRNDALVLNKLNTLGHIDAELRTLETALGERDTVTVLREAGITACPRCAAIHSGDDRFCPNCGLSMGRHVELPIAGPPSASAPAVPAAPPREGTAFAGGATASWPAVSPDAPVTAPEGQARGAPSAATTSAAASAPGATPAPPPAPPPGATTDAGAQREGARAPAEKTGRSPRPPSSRAPAGSAAQETAADSEDGEQTEILHPLEPDR